MKSIPELHALFCAITGMPISLNYYRESCWFQWQKMGWNGQDLKLVVDWIKKQNAKGGKYKMTFSKLIEDWPHFEELLGEARAQSRKPVIERNRADTLRASGRSDIPPQKDAVPASVVLEQLKLAQDLKAWREKTLR